MVALELIIKQQKKDRLTLLVSQITFLGDFVSKDEEYYVRIDEELKFESLKDIIENISDLSERDLLSLYVSIVDDLD